MMIRLGLRVLGLVFVLMSLGRPVNAQWGAPYTNNWIAYGKPYVKIGVTKRGIQKVLVSSLPSGFPVSQPERFQLWHRGKQVAIISANQTEIIFFGVTNDGASDSLLYRPMSARMNPYTSLYSDESAYFLTSGDVNGLRAATVNIPVNANQAAETVHYQTDVTAYTNEYSLSTLSAFRASFFNSFFENGASKTGVTVVGSKVTTSPIALTNWNKTGKNKPVLKLLIHGRNNNLRTIEVSVGKTDKSLRKVTGVSISNFTGEEYSFQLEPGDLDDSGKGVLALFNTSTDTRDRYSLAYYTLTYQQDLVMAGKKTSEFNFAASAAASTRISIANAPSGAGNYDISDPDVPRIISGQLTNFMVSRSANKALKLHVSNETTTIDKAKISAVSMNAITPKDFNYVIITNETLEAGATEYATYRASAGGGGYKPVVVRIKDIYNQFNYGEPSPVAIRRFADFMVSDKNLGKHLFLFGKSTSFNERMIRELPDEVPTVGFPGSDVLLVEGLGGAGADVPAMAIGRLSALSVQQVRDYLAKVKEYEVNAGSDVSWRKNILHLNGGKSAEEITQLKNILAGLAPLAEKGFVGAKVTPFVKQQGIVEVETVNITPEINGGVGLLTYFGHGSTTVTDLDIGYSTDAARGYNNASKYPLMYFNGCGVGNIFSGRFNTSPSASDRIALSLDWILAAKKGTIAIVANTFDTYVSSTSHYLQHLYGTMFSNAATSQLSIGQVQIEVAKRVFADDHNTFEIANVHQALLQGDPAIRMIYVAKPDYALDPDESIRLYAVPQNKTLGTSDSIQTSITLSNKGRYVAQDQIPVQVKFIYRDGSEAIKTQNTPSMPNAGTLQVTLANRKNLKSVIVTLDPENKLDELSKTNNVAELLVDWDIAQQQAIYPTGTVKDVLAPTLDVRFDGRIVANQEVVRKNPVVTFTLSDDRVLQADSSLIDVFIRACADDNSCDYVKLNYAGQLTLAQGTTNKMVQVTYAPAGLANGTYQLLVNTRDLSGNESAKPYQVVFNVKDSIISPVVMVSPNPASAYVRFQADHIDAAANKTIKAVIYNLNGVLIDSREVEVSQGARSEWYWTPPGSGVFIYRITTQEGKQMSGKVQVYR